MNSQSNLKAFAVIYTILALALSFKGGVGTAGTVLGGQRSISFQVCNKIKLQYQKGGSSFEIYVHSLWWSLPGGLCIAHMIYAGSGVSKRIR